MVTTRVATAHLQAGQLNPSAWPNPTATSPANPTTTSAVRGEASLDLVRCALSLEPPPTSPRERFSNLYAMIAEMMARNMYFVPNTAFDG